MWLSRYDVNPTMDDQTLTDIVHHDFFKFKNITSSYELNTNKILYIYNLITAWSKNISESSDQIDRRYKQYLGDCMHSDNLEFEIDRYGTVEVTTSFCASLEDIFTAGYRACKKSKSIELYNDGLNGFLMRIITALASYDHEEAKKLYGARDGE